MTRRGLILAALIASPSMAALTIQDCPNYPPTAARCSDNSWVTGICGVYWNASDPNGPCGAIMQQVQSNYQATYQTGPSTEKIFDKTANDFIASQPPPIRLPVMTSRTGTQNTWANQEEKARYDAAQTTPFFPLWYQRQNGDYSSQPINSCEAYVYKSFYDVEKWIDGMNACKNDARCIVVNSLWGMTATGPAAKPGIARRKMQDIELNDISSRLYDLTTQGKLNVYEADPFAPQYALPDDFPKNQFYSNTASFIVPALIDAFTADGQGPQIQAFLDELVFGQSYYETGIASPVTGGKWFQNSYNQIWRQGFYDEWDFHRVMQNRTKDVTDGESREYRRRRAEVLQQYEVVLDQTKCMYADAFMPGGCGAGTPTAIGKVHPGDAQMWEGDPFVANAYLGNINTSYFVSPPALQGMLVAIDGTLMPGNFSQSVTMGSQLLMPSSSLSTMLSATARLPVSSQNVAMGSQLGSLAQYLQLASTTNTQGQGLGALLGTGLGNFFGGLGGAFGSGGGAGKTVIGGVAIGAATMSPTTQLAYSTEQTRLGTVTTDAYVVGGGSGGGRIPGAGGTGLGLPQPPMPPPHVDAASQVKFGNSAWLVQTLWLTNPPKIDHSVPYPHLDCTVPSRIDSIDRIGGGLKDDMMHTRRAWKAVCEMTNLLLDEWGRKLTGVPSCYDEGKYACDWEPQDFVDRFVTRNVNYGSAAKEVEYKWCKRWTGGTGFNDASHPSLYVPPANRSSLNSFRDLLTNRQVQFEKVFATVPVKQPDDFGTMRTDENHIGDNTFGGGYSYQLGWHAKVMQRTKDGQICRLGGTAIASFNAEAIIFGGHASLIDADAVVSSNENDSGTATGETHLTVVGYDIFNTGDIDLSAGWSDTEGDSENPELFEVPFQAGPVTVTVTVGLSYDYGVTAALSSHPPKPTDCSPDAPLYSAQASFTPFADLGVWADADASLAGIVGVGLEVQLTLVGLQLPLVANADLILDKDNDLAIKFNAMLNLDLHTLDGEIDFYIKALFMKVASFTLVKWPGFHHNFPIFRTPDAVLPLPFLIGQDISPPGAGSDTN